MIDEKCPHCGRSMKKFWHRITPGLVKVLVKCYEKVCSKQKNIFNMNELNLTHSEYGNFNKLRFHALIAKHRENGKVVGKEWVLTTRGVDFLKGNIQIPSRVQTFDNKVVEHDEYMVTISDVMKNQEYWEVKFDYDIFEPKQGFLI